MKKTPCALCKKPISGAKTVIDGLWHCAECTYKHDHPGKEIVKPVKRRGPRIQSETLFPTAPQTKGTPE